jgi:hypothetical protein
MLSSKGDPLDPMDGRVERKRRYLGADAGGGGEAGDFVLSGAELVGGAVDDGLSGALAGGFSGVAVEDVPGVAEPVVPLVAAPPVLAPLVVVAVPDVPGTIGPVAVVLVPELPAPGAPANPVPGVESTLTAVMQSKIQKAATPIVIRVKRSPAFAPNALWPPMPPSAPAKPPPRPRCSSTMRIRKQAVMTRKNPKRK